VPGRTCRIYWRYWTDARLRRRFQLGFPEAAFSVDSRGIVETRWRLGASPASRADGSHRAVARDTVPAGSTGSTGVTGRRLYWRYWSYWLHWRYWKAGTPVRLVILARPVDPDTVRCTGVHRKMGRRLGTTRTVLPGRLDLLASLDEPGRRDAPMRLVILVRPVDPDTVRCTGVHGKMGRRLGTTR
jgi:hypothetical protein